MKKLGFTLAEVLIAMGLVGVIAAMTVPTFVVNCRQQANDSKFAATAADLENAFGNMVVSELVNDFTETAFYSSMTKANLEKYVKLNRGGTKAELYGSIAFKQGDGCKTTLVLNPTTVLELKNGAYFLVMSKTEGYIDVNGKDKPNCLSRDKYKVEINKHGFLKKK